MLFYVDHLLTGGYIIHDIVMHAVCVVCRLILKKLALTFMNTLGSPLLETPWCPLDTNFRLSQLMQHTQSQSLGQEKQLLY